MHCANNATEVTSCCSSERNILVGFLFSREYFGGYSQENRGFGLL